MMDFHAGNLESISEHFQENIQTTLWPELKIPMIRRYLRLLTDHFPQPNYLPYYLETFEYLHDALIQFKKINVAGAGVPPEAFTDLIGGVEKSKPTGLENHIPRLITEIRNRLQEQIIRSYFRVLAWRELNTFLKIDKNPALQLFHSAVMSNEVPSEIRQRIYLEAVRKIIPGNLTEYLSNEFELLNTCRSSRSSITVMVAARNHEHEIGIFGSLSLINAEYQLKPGVDQLRISTHHIDITDPIILQTKEICAFLHSHLEIDETARIKLGYDLNLPPSSLGGNSMGLAMTILASDGLKRYRKNPVFDTQYYSDVGITGAIAEDGTVLPVEDRGLKQKITAAFYSRLNTVIIPSGQIETANRCLTPLRGIYPLRNFTVIPVSHVDHVAHRREIINIQRRKISSRFVQFVKDYANSVTYAVLGFVVLCAALFYFVIVKNPVPEYIEYINDRFAVKNKYGFLLWFSEKYPKNNIWYIGDINKDEKREVLISYSVGTKQSENSGKLFCYDEKGKTLWWIDAGKSVRYGKQIIDDFFYVSHIIVDDFNFDGTSEILAVSLQGNFPNRYFLVSSTGDLISEYWHCGGLNEYIVTDVIPDNGRKEIILAGRNNEYCSAVLLVLDPFVMSGQSPYEKYKYTKLNTELGNEIYYLRFPYTHFRVPPFRDFINRLNINEKGEYRFAISNNRKEIQQLQGLAHYVLDKNFKFININIADNYIKAYMKIFPCRETLPFTEAELQEHFKAVDYWDGDKWVKEPIINRRYLQSEKN